MVVVLGVVVGGWVEGATVIEVVTLVVMVTLSVIPVVLATDEFEDALLAENEVVTLLL